MELTNKNVRHRYFGKGTICELEDSVLSVRFASGVKKFIYPDAFRTFLVPDDEKCKNYVNNVLEEIDREIKQDRENERLRHEKLHRLKKLPAHAKAQAAFGFIENDVNEALDNWSVFTGKYRSGYNRGEPRIPTRINPNTACMMTFCEDRKVEEDRYIFGVFMVKDDYIGSECYDGIIDAHDKFRIILDVNERKNFKFWKYFDDASDKTPKWGYVEVKYFSNITMAHILSDILNVKKGTDEQQLCEDFLEYFCKLNKIEKASIPGYLGNQISNE